MLELPRSVEGLSLAEKRMLLAKLLQEKADRKEEFSLSQGQRGLWLIHQMDPLNPAYNISFPSRLRSRLDVDAFRQSLQALVDRHPSLRTTYSERDGALLQRVHEAVPVAFEVFDALSWSDESIKTRVAEEILRPFDLEQGPLLRTCLFTRAVDDHVFLAVAHHIGMDFWSLIVMLTEIRELYSAACEGRDAELPPAGSSYLEFVRWQDKLLASPKGERLGSYWEQYLEGVPHVLELPADKPRPAVFSNRAGVIPCQIPADLTQGLVGLAADEKVTMYAVLLAAFQVLLYRQSGQRDFVIGTPFVGRSRSEFEQTVGYFMNLLPMRANIEGDPTFRELLGRVGTATLDALEHQDFPFAMIVDRLNVVRDPSRPPLVQTSFTLEKSHRQEELGRGRFFFPDTKAHANVGGLLGETYYIAQETCRHEIDLVVEHSGGTIQGLLCYCSDLFDSAAMQRMVRHFQTLLGGAVASPDVPISQLPWFSEAERHQVIHDWNQTRMECRGTACLHRLFEQQVGKTPRAVAMSGGGKTYRYEELDAWANRLARRLGELGARPGDFVALCVDRSPELMALIIATLKAGCVFVPLDPESPTQRLQLMVKDTAATIVVAPPQLVPALRERVTAKVVCVDDLQQHESQGANPGPPSHDVQPGDLAYVIYTSGSSGQPKGVMVEHRAVCNMMFSRKNGLDLGDGDRILMALPFVFDAAVGETFATFVQGAQVVLADPKEELNPLLLAERIVREDVTTIAAPPRLMGAILDHLTVEQCQNFRRLHVGGETMAPDLLTRVVDGLGVPLYNFYGPTEAGIETTRWGCHPGDAPSTIVIGRPIDNVLVYVLDPGQRPLPVGVPGELYIGGGGVARGYLNDPALTAERFVEDPFCDKPGSRMYRTGDSCRWMEDGNLEFLGRLDQQVKVRGYRIELGEIESVLTKDPAVAEAAVVVCTSRSGEPQLVAYLVLAENQNPPETDVLRRNLRRNLPNYMVPALFEWLDHLPRTTSGKLDRRALPDPQQQGTARASYLAARTPLEEFLVESCQKILQIDQVGVNDGFYELGGTSIQGALLLSSLQEELGLRVHSAALFDLSTIGDVADHLAKTYPEAIAAQFGAESVPSESGSLDSRLGDSSDKLDAPSNLLVALQPDGDRLPLFMVHPPGGIVVCYQPLARFLGTRQPLYGVRARGLHGELDLPETLEDMATEYVVGMRSVQPHGPYALGGWSLGGVVAMEMAQQLLDMGETVDLLTFLDTTIPQGASNEDYAEADQTGLEYGLDITLEQLGELGPDEQLPFLWEHAQLGILDESAPEALVQQMLNDLKRLFHSHVKLAHEYRVRPYPGRVVLFRPEDAPVKVAVTPDRGWRRLAGDVSVHMVPGQHHSMVKEPHVQVLAQKLSTYLRA